LENSEDSTLEFNTADTIDFKILAKIEQAKRYFEQGTITKSGKNNYQKFKYFELTDILPVVRKACKELKLVTKFDMDDTTAVLMIGDIESKQKAYYPASIKEFNYDGNVGKYCQGVGAMQTYFMRYLYIRAFEIAVPDEIEQNIGKTKKTKGYTNGKQLKADSEKGIVAGQSTLKATHEKPLIDICKNISEELASKGVEVTKTALLEKVKDMKDNLELNREQYFAIRNLIQKNY